MPVHTEVLLKAPQNRNFSVKPARYQCAAPRQPHGFSVVEILIALFLVLLLVIGGWYLWSRTTTTPKDQSASTATTRAGSSASPQKEPTVADPSEGGKYLVIKEWGVRFRVPDPLRNDIKYGIFTFNNGEQAAYFASKELASKSADGRCDLASISDSAGQGVYGGTIALTRSKSQPEGAAELSFRIDGADYWYALGVANGGACYEGDSGQEKSKFNSLINEAVRKLEPIEQ